MDSSFEVYCIKTFKLKITKFKVEFHKYLVIFLLIYTKKGKNYWIL